MWEGFPKGKGWLVHPRQSLQSRAGCQATSIPLPSLQVLASEALCCSDSNLEHRAEILGGTLR